MDRRSDTRPLVLLGLGNRQERLELAQHLEPRGFGVEHVRDSERTLNAVDSILPDALVVDQRLDRLEGLRLLELVLGRMPDMCVILISDRHDVEFTAEAVRAGAHDVQSRPIDRERLLAVLERGAGIGRLRRQVDELSQRLDQRFGFDHFVGGSAVILEIVDRIRQVAPTRATVLITGESGTGKELVASSIHHNSPRRDHPFVKLNCAALAEGVIESELFGHERSAFGGSVGARVGRFEIADGGTLFLDEISELTLPIQTKLMRVLRDREFERVGGNRTFKIDTRVIVATNRNIEAEVRSGRFREDLYYRLNIVTVNIPPLRRRREDIPLLVEAFLRELEAVHQKPVPGISAGAMEVLASYPWPGNVRELRNTIEGMVLFAVPGQTLGVDDLPELLRTPAADGEESIAVCVGMTMEEVERRLIAATYRASGRDKPRTASVLGIGLRTLYRKLKDYDLN